MTNTVFSVNELASCIEYNSENALRASISYHLLKGKIEKLTKGLYSLPGRAVEPFELANKMYSPSYITGSSALYHHGIIFQHPGTQVELAYKKTAIRVLKEIDLQIQLRSFKSDVLFNTLGLIRKSHYTIASPERAFLDSVYLTPNKYFDNLSKLNRELLINILPIYGRDTVMKKRLKTYF